MSIQLRSIAPIVVLMTVAASAQTVAPNQTAKQYIRSIEILPVATSPAGLPETGVQKALAHIPIVAGSALAPDALVAAIERADQGNSEHLRGPRQAGSSGARDVFAWPQFDRHSISRDRAVFV